MAGGAAPGGGWAAPGLTDVRFRDGDPVGGALAYAANAPVWCVAHICGAAYASREVRSGLLLAGLAGNYALSYAAKRVAGQPRPQEFCGDLGTCSSPGMPSTHAQFMAFLAGHAAARARLRPASTLRRLEAAALAVLAALVAASRVYLGYHSPAQVAAGAALGMALGVLWSAAVECAGAAGLLWRLAASPLGEALLLKDSEGAGEPGGAEAGAPGPGALSSRELAAERRRVLPGPRRKAA